MIGNFFLGIVVGAVIIQSYDLFIMWYDGLMWANKEPIYVYTTDGEEVYDEEYFPRTIDEIEVHVNHTEQKEEE